MIIKGLRDKTKSELDWALMPEKRNAHNPAKTDGWQRSFGSARRYDANESRG
jgi:hypothetical protein